MSIGFELLEYSLQHQLPNFNECWWDHVIQILDKNKKIKTSFINLKISSGYSTFWFAMVWEFT